MSTLLVALTVIGYPVGGPYYTTRPHLQVALLNPNILRYLQLYTVQRDAQMREQEKGPRTNRSSRKHGWPSSNQKLSRQQPNPTDSAAGNPSASESLRGSTGRRVTIRESFNEIRRSLRRRSSSVVSVDLEEAPDGEPS